MTDLENRDRAGKRERLVASATDLLHRQGVFATTLAQVAAAAEVPTGNVYYYFKTKDELILAVIDARTHQVRVMLDSLEARPSPDARLKALTRHWGEMADVAARYGCPFGTLCSELDRREDGLDQAAAKPIRLILEWAEAQFRLLGEHDPRESALTLFAGVQGGALLANAYRDPEIMTGQVRRLERWIDSLS